MKTSGMLIAVAAAVALCGISACDDSREYQNPMKSEQTAELKQKMGQKKDQAGTAIDDTAISSKVRAAIVAEPNLSVFTIDVTTKDGAVTLSGNVASEALSDRAEELARKVEGVKLVNNDLAIKPDTTG